MEDYREVNRGWWDERAPAHAASRGYAVDRFVSDPAYLSDVVRFDVPRLGHVRGLQAVHLQCHIGTDSVSLARLGAHVTGLDLSPASLEQARRLAERTGADVAFVEGEVYEAVGLLGEACCDLVYTGIGALCWLPDIGSWAQVVAGLLRPGGRLFLREASPVLWALADARADGLLVLEHPYFETPAPVVWEEPGTYVDSEVDFVRNRSVEWNHGYGDILTALLAAGLQLTALVEHDSVPYEALVGQMDRHDGEWRLRDRPERLPLTYTLQAVRRP